MQFTMRSIFEAHLCDHHVYLLHFRGGSRAVSRTTRNHARPRGPADSRVARVVLVTAMTRRSQRASMALWQLAANRTGTPGGARHRRSRSATPTLTFRKTVSLTLDMRRAADQGVGSTSASRAQAWPGTVTPAQVLETSSSRPRDQRESSRISLPVWIGREANPESSVASLTAAGSERTSRHQRSRHQSSLKFVCDHDSNDTSLPPVFPGRATALAGPQPCPSNRL